MNILLVTQDYFPARGGIQSYCHQLAVGLVAKGHRLTLLCPGVNHPDDINAPFKIERIQIQSSFLFLKLFGRLKKRVEAEAATGRAFDHVLFAQWQNGIPLLLKSQRFKGPAIHSMVHGRELLHGVFGPLTGWLSQRVYRHFDSVVPNSNPIADLFRRTVPHFHRIQVVHPGVDPQRFIPKDTSALKKELRLEGKVVLTSITRLVARKNIALVVKALPLVLDKIPNAHFVMGGTGPEFENIKTLIAEMKLQSHVSVIGNVPEERLVEYFSLGDVFLLPSSESKTDVEGFGIVFLEAGACEVPVIGAQTGGIVDAVIHNETGFLLGEISEQSLASAIVQILSRADRGKSLGVAARQRILSELSWEKCAQAYVDKVFTS